MNFSAVTVSFYQCLLANFKPDFGFGMTLRKPAVLKAVDPGFQFCETCQEFFKNNWKYAEFTYFLPKNEFPV